MRKRNLLLLPSLLFPFQSLSFDGLMAQPKATDFMVEPAFEVYTVNGKEAARYEGGRLVIVPKKPGDSDFESAFSTFMRSCDDCMEAPLVPGVRPGRGRKPLPLTSPNEFCSKYPGLFGCPKKD